MLTSHDGDLYPLLSLTATGIEGGAWYRQVEWLPKLPILIILFSLPDFVKYDVVLIY